MKGAYITKLDFHVQSARGVINKIKSQKKAFRQNGVEISLYNRYKSDIYRDETRIYTSPNLKILSKVSNEVMFYRTVLSDLNNKTLDFVYIRYPLSSPIFLWFLKKIKILNANLIVIVEIPTYPYLNEGNTPKRKVLNFLDKIFNKKLLKYVDRIVTFYAQDVIHGIKTIKLTNGIDTIPYNDIVPHLKSENPIEIRLTAVANLKYYHGYDRVIKGIAENQTNYSIVFNIVGGGPELETLKDLVRSCKLENKVIFHGFKEGEDLKNILSKTDIGVGTLGMFRKGLNLDSSLKTREYCLNGIPFIISCEDPDFPDEFKFKLHVSNDEENINCYEIVEFYRYLQEQINYQRDLHNYACEKLSWKSKMAKVIDFIAQFK